ncbi:MAG: antitoxin [Clostridia bacterium]|nr:antitoxin [Clostridia bacterium]
MKERYDEIKIRTPKGKKQIIQERAKEAKESLNSYINRAIDELMSKKGDGHRISSAEK